MQYRDHAHRSIEWLRFAIVVGALAGCTLSAWRTFEISAAEPAAKQVAIEKLNSETLPNLVQVTDKVISGGLPADDAAFKELSERGIKTIISVDGAKPDVAAAQKHGLRYVHLPHGYNGISDEQVQELAKAVRDLPGPIYVHCHHGKHRSPAAAAAACVTAGTLTADDAGKVLKIADTSPNYRGLFQSVATAKPAAAKSLDDLKVTFRETVELTPLAEAMVAIEHTHDRLKSLGADNWEASPKDPDVNAAHEALLLKEHFTELLRTPEVARQPRGFIESMQAGEAAATKLEALLLNPNSDAKQRAAALEATTANCKSCHQMFRDIPLSEKKPGGGE